MSDTPTSYRGSFLSAERAAFYEEQYGAGTYGSIEWKLEQAQLRRILRKHLPAMARCHLDFACGTGRLTRYLAHHSDSTIGVDISAEMVAIARHKCPGVRFIVSDITINPEHIRTRGPFDLVSIFRFLTPAEPPLRGRVLEELTKCVSSGGLVIVNNNANIASLLYFVLALKALASWTPLQKLVSYRQSLSSRGVQDLLNAHGLQVVETRAVCYLPSHLTSRLPTMVWYPFEWLLGYVGILPWLAVNQIVVARKR